MISQEIRRRFLSYFKQSNHAIISSSPVVPHDDPTLLFTNAGMNQFKDVFLGKSQREYTRASTAQKCIRVGGKHNDLDNVGHTSRHLTFFEMLGNFSFGDYFKEQAINYAWDVSTAIFGFDPERLFVTVFREDDEAFELWKKIIPEKKIVRMDEKDNFWEMGEAGPCGPCSELYYDKGERYGSASSIKEDLSGERYIEFWNLVFMQYNKSTSGKMVPLPKPSIDTGAGLERIISLKMGVDSIFATDIFRSLIASIENISKQSYQPVLAPAYHVIADHIRSLAFAIADGATPSNVERGYILRKLLRRAVRYGKLLGMQEPFLAKILPRLVEVMGEDYPELGLASGRIAEILQLEEEAFFRTLKRGGNLLNVIIDKAQSDPQKQITGEEAFTLKDTYGLPIEEILLIAKDSALTVNLDAYQLLEKQAKERSKKAQSTHAQEVQENVFQAHVHTHGSSQFLGYQQIVGKGVITAIVHEGTFVNTLNANQEGTLILNQTPFYPEKGGQVGDTGTITSSGASFLVTHCTTPYPGVIAHAGKLETGTLRLGEELVTTVDAKRREEISNHHTATHLLHWALQQVLGNQIRQAGSLVDEGRLRFDFTHHKSLSQEELRKIEGLVNQKVREGTPVKSYELSYEEAQRHPEIKQFFGEKYGSKVRVIDIGASKELCGGTHTVVTSTIGYFRITKETSIAAGVRRIEAVCGERAENFVYAEEDLLEKTANLLKTSPLKLLEKGTQLLEENRVLSVENRRLKQEALKPLSKELLTKVQKVGEISFLGEIVSVDTELLPELIDSLINHVNPGVILLATKGEGRCQVNIRVSKDLVNQGVNAVTLIKELAPLFGGGGGGKGESAQAGGKNPEGIPLAIDHMKQWLNRQ